MVEDTSLTKDGFYRKMEKLLNMGPESIQGKQSLSSLKSWDSLTILEFIVLADNDYSSDIQPTDIAACKTVDELAELTFLHSGLKRDGLDSGNK